MENARRFHEVPGPPAWRPESGATVVKEDWEQRKRLQNGRMFGTALRGMRAKQTVRFFDSRQNNVFCRESQAKGEAHRGDRVEVRDGDKTSAGSQAVDGSIVFNICARSRHTSLRRCFGPALAQISPLKSAVAAGKMNARLE